MDEIGHQDQNSNIFKKHKHPTHASWVFAKDLPYRTKIMNQSEHLIACLTHTLTRENT